MKVKLVKVDRLKVVTIKLDKEIVHWIDVYAMNNNLTRSDVIRFAIIKFMEEHKGGVENEQSA